MPARELYPLVFEPLITENVWGGARLADLGKPLVPGRPHGESWEIVDLPGAQSVVAEGPLAGETLQGIVSAFGEALLGPVRLDGGRFPLLVKYIDAAQTLSVQVHPDEAAVARLGKGRPKNEAWYILDVEPGAVLYLGFKPGVGRPDLERALAAPEGGRVEALLQAVEVAPGDLVAVLPGTVHAIGAGVLLAEVQQPSDTTYRVYDWGRVGLDGRPRALHVAEALECIDFDRRVTPGATRLDAGHFVARVLTPAADLPVQVDGAGPRVVVGLEGDLGLAAGTGERSRVVRGRVVLLPHCLPEVTLEGAGRALVVTFPT